MLRKIAFQIHLWLGLLAGAVLLVLGLSGSLLVFRPALDHSAYQPLPHAASIRPTSLTPIEDGRKAVESANPNYRIRFVMPAASVAGVNQYLLFPSKGAAYNPLLSSTAARTGELFSTAPLKSGWLYWVRDLHSNFLSGPSGRTVAGIFALLLMTMCLSGLVTWLPKRHWRISFRAGWKRQVWNLHNTVGVFALLLLFCQGFIGTYFAFPAPFRAALGLPARARPEGGEAGNARRGGKKRGHKKSEQTANPPASLPLDTFLQNAHQTWPEYKVAAIYPPARAGEPLTIRGRMPADPEGRDDSSRLTFDAQSGKLLRLQQGSQLIFGEKVIAQMQAIHYGRFQNSLVSHIIWVLLGLAPGTLYITGLIMWINRIKAKWRVRRVMQDRLQTKPEPELVS
jgi:uncharacterized iron-regulated membrane protein